MKTFRSVRPASSLLRAVRRQGPTFGPSEYATAPAAVCCSNNTVPKGKIATTPFQINGCAHHRIPRLPFGYQGPPDLRVRAVRQSSLSVAWVRGSPSRGSIPGKTTRSSPRQLALPRILAESRILFDRGVTRQRRLKRGSQACRQVKPPGATLSRQQSKLRAKFADLRGQRADGAGSSEVCEDGGSEMVVLNIRQIDSCPCSGLIHKVVTSIEDPPAIPLEDPSENV